MHPSQLLVIRPAAVDLLSQAAIAGCGLSTEGVALSAVLDTKSWVSTEIRTARRLEFPLTVRRSAGGCDGGS